MTTILAFLFVLGVLVFVHELGHFVVARFYGVRVLTFSLGFGPKLLKYRAVEGGTEYSVSALPLGGYVKLAGETLEEERTGAPDEFMSKSKWVRFQVYLAGPIMNVLLAWLLMTIVFSRGTDTPLYETSAPVVGSIAAGSPAQAGGLEVGDDIVRIATHDVRTWDEFEEEVSFRTNKDTAIDVLRAGRPLTLHVTPRGEGSFDIGKIGIGPVVHPQFAQILPGGAAAKAGLEAGDVILGANGTRGLNRDQILTLIKASPAKTVVFTLGRADETVDVPVVPASQGGSGVIGALLTDREYVRTAPGWEKAAVQSVHENWDRSAFIVRTMRGLLTAETPVKQLMGPVAIAQFSGEAASMGWLTLFDFMAMISLNLGLINLLPVPVMDGGQIAILALEGASRRDLSARVKERVLLAGAAFVVLLMVTVIYNDVMRLVK